ncbi:SCO family protein [Rivibacter subsaxonicus]|uniref:Protein SCO1/2 n=1 Tax=Rivibacter subsaxonicus TaxID=457575 RepID=A0A4Q7VGX8_9BURK|nr:SCO family protein [Rivibacter subsaxonicus]RZT95208.1 protein SCO1/2 [Rivibacter subsaxonicus]
MNNAMIRRYLLLVATGLLTVALAGCDKLPGVSAPKAEFKAVDITGTEMGKGLVLSDVDGKSRTMADFKGKVTVVFFGFTQCPDVCPTTLAEFVAIKKALGADGARLQPVFISVDPERDTAEILKAYMAAFDPGFVALRGTLDQTAAAAKSFKAFYQKVPGKTPGSYTMDHTAGSYVFDADGRARLFVRYGQPVEDWVSDLKQLMS